jgi:CYTH domain-containing protein
MGLEIERKFLVKKDQWQPPHQGKIYRQGYIHTHSRNTVRVRVVGDQGYLTLKGKTTGSTRREFEYLIPVKDAEEMLDTLCDRPLIEKIRYKITIDGFCWEVDQFLGDNEGLLLAEIELQTEEQTISLPSWIDQEVTDDLRYYNVNLVQNPYKNW